jgi:predicted transcriptional regulator
MPDDGAPSTHVTLRMPADVAEQFARLASLLDRPRSWVMLRALKQYLEAEGAELAEDAESLAELDRGESEPFDTTIAEVRQIVERSGAKNRS